MKKKIALLVYPEFSLQEVTNLMYLFRWAYDTTTDIIYTEKEVVKSEEGITVLPVKTCDEFSVKDYDCLILPGCSDTRQASLTTMTVRADAGRMRKRGKEFIRL